MIKVHGQAFHKETCLLFTTFSGAFRLDPTLNPKQGHIQVFDVSLFGPTSVRFEFLQVLISQIPTYSGISDGDLARICQQIETNRQQKGGTCMHGVQELQDTILFRIASRFESGRNT